MLLLCLHIYRGWAVAACALAVFLGWWNGFYWTHTRTGHFFFDPQDCAASEQPTRQFPLSAKSATFEPLLKHYIGVTQLVFTISAASIAFGGTQGRDLIVIAKLALAWSILYGILFCALLLWRYDEYIQDVTSYTPRWYSTIFACAFSSLTCFCVGFFLWSLGL
jgi:hypothetical protein